jgi:toxic protein SymE
MKKRSRKLKVYKKYVSRGSSRYVGMPEIRLCGIWLKQAGFELAE